MGSVGVEIITRPVEVYWYQIDGIKSKLLPICLALDEKHLLGKPIRRISFLGIAIPEMLFFKGYGSKLWIRADSPDTNELVQL